MSDIAVSSPHNSTGSDAHSSRVGPKFDSSNSTAQPVASGALHDSERPATPPPKEPAKERMSADSVGAFPPAKARPVADYLALSEKLSQLITADVAERTLRVTVLVDTFISGASTQSESTSRMVQGDVSAGEAPVGAVSTETPSTNASPGSDEASGVDALVELIALFLSIQADMNRMMTTLRNYALAERMERKLAQVDAIKKAADYAFNAALVQGVMTAASGAVSIAGGLYSLKQIGQAGAPQSNESNIRVTAVDSGGVANGPVPNQSSVPLDLATQKAQAANNIAQGSASLMTGAGTIGGAVYQREAGYSQAEQTEQEALAQSAEHSMNDFLQAVQQGSQAISAVLQALVALLQAYVQGMRPAMQV